MTTPAVASPAAAIGPLWSELRRDPLQPDSWLALAQAYAAAGLAPQQASSSWAQAWLAAASSGAMR